VELASLPHENTTVSKPCQREGHDLKTGRNDVEKKRRKINELDYRNFRGLCMASLEQFPRGREKSNKKKTVIS